MNVYCLFHKEISTLHCNTLNRIYTTYMYMYMYMVYLVKLIGHFSLTVMYNPMDIFKFFNPFASGIKKVLLYPITGLFSVKIQKKFLAIKNFSVNDTMSG